MNGMQRVGNVQLMQTMNRIKVFEHIRHNEPTTRPAIAAKTGLSVSSITNIVSHLIDRGLVQELALETNSLVGRRATLLGVRTGIHRMICASVEREHVHFRMVDLRGNVMHESRAALPDTDHEGLLERVAAGVRDLLPQARRAPVAAIAVSVPGVVLDDGMRVSSISMRWKSLDFKTPLEERFSLPVFIQNVSIARAMWVLSEARRDTEHGKIPQNAAFFDMERGIGAVHMTENRINPWFLGEIGHISINIDGPACFCGNKGCIETYCMPEYIVSRCAGSDSIKTFADAADAAERGDERAVRAVTDAARYVGVSLTNILNLLSPSVVYINANELGRSALLMDKAYEWAANHALAAASGRVRYVPVRADKNAVHLGLGEYALDRLLVPEHATRLLG